MYRRMTSWASWAPALFALIVLVPFAFPLHERQEVATESSVNTKHFTQDRPQPPAAATPDDVNARDRFSTHIPRDGGGYSPESPQRKNKFQSASYPELSRGDAASLLLDASFHAGDSHSMPRLGSGQKSGLTTRADEENLWVVQGEQQGDADPHFSHAAKVMFGQKFKVRISGAPPPNNKAKNVDALQSGEEIDDLLKSQNRQQNMVKILNIFGESLKLEEPQSTPKARPDNDKTSDEVSLPHDDKENLTSCIHVDGYDEHRWIRVVNFCPRSWTNQTVKFLCKEALANDYVMTDTPVQDVRGVVYANRYCARCNFVRKLRRWKIAWTCDSPDPVSAFFQPKPSEDVLGMVTTLRRGNYCKLTRSPAVPRGIYPCPAVTARDHHSMPLVNSGDHFPPGSGYPVSLNILMNFDFAGKTHIMFEDYYFEENYDDTKRCPEDNYVWDGEMGRCREVVCAEGFHFDDTFTTCVEDDEKNLEEVITDLSQLAQSNDIERVTLTVEVPPGYVPLFQLTEYHDLWKTQIVNQLNITINRIQMFNISVDVGTGEGSTLVIEKLGNEKDRSAQIDENHADGDMRSSAATSSGDRSEEISKEKDRGHADAKGAAGGGASRPLEASPETRVLKPSSNEGGGNALDKVPASRAGAAEAGPGERVDGDAKKAHALSRQSWISSSSAERLLSKTSSSTPYDTPLTLPTRMTTTLAPEKKGKIIMSFILLPPQSFELGQRSGPLVQELNSLVSKGELKFTINGTSLTVDKVAKEDTVGVFSPACPNGLLLVLDGQQVQLLYGDNNMTMLQDLRTGKFYVQGMFDVSFLVTQPIGNTTMQPQSYVFNALACEMPHIANSRCKRIRIKKEEYSIDSSTKALTFQNVTYNITSYEYMDDQYNRVEICVPQSYSETQVLVHPSRVIYKNCATGYDAWLETEGYLTLVLGCVSIVALFSVLLTYFLFAKLRNLPGVNTMNLTFALFLAEVIFATGEEVQIPWLCTSVAVTLHYCFLASHCWMCVMSYDVYRTFAGNTCILTRVRDKKKFFPRYALFAWGMPLLVIGACLFIEFSHVFPGVSIGYGGSWAEGRNANESGFYSGNWSEYGAYQSAAAATTTTTVPSAGNDGEGGSGDSPDPTTSNETVRDATKLTAKMEAHSFSCWIQKPLAAMFAFGAPIMVIFLLNLAFFTKTIASIERTTRLARHSGAGRTNSSNSARQMNGRNDVILYVKMASVMGFTWVFGLASSVISAVTTEPTTSVCYGMHVLGVLFPILNSSQGLFIFFAFVFNRRVLQLYRCLGRKGNLFLVRQKNKLVSSRWNRPMTDIFTVAKN